mgnify:CR=1 FL=1
MAGVTIEGVVEHGRRLGRELGFPTANMAVPDSVTAADGVYYSRVEVDGTRYDAMSNLGSNPSVGGAVRHLETHIFGFGGSLYGRTLRVELVRKIRDERRFATIGELRAQIASEDQPEWREAAQIAAGILPGHPLFQHKDELPSDVTFEEPEVVPAEAVESSFDLNAFDETPAQPATPAAPHNSHAPAACPGAASVSVASI